MKRKLLASVATLLLSVSVLVGCASNTPSAAKKYIIATDATYAPFEFEENGKYVGIDIELLEAISKSEGFTYELKPMDFSGIIPGIQANQIDAGIAGVSITEERKKTVDFSEPYYDSGVAIVAKVGTDIKGEADLQGKTFSVKKGTAGAGYAESIKDKYGATLVYFNDTPGMFQAVTSGNADVAFEDFPVAAYKFKTEANPELQVVGEKVTSTPYGFIVKKGANAELLKMFNDGLAKLKANGEYQKIVDKYLAD
jgi:polar amino acid transport system substrate-binding protein